ncbi:MAG: hypothetical protein ACREJX_17270, partial [Polyangiaceae bacterium]
MRTLAAFIVLMLPLPAAAAPCVVEIGQRVRLAANSSDPNVFVWDSRDDLIAYAAGRYGSVDTVVRHAALVPPGTRAIVAMCRA